MKYIQILFLIAALILPSLTLVSCGASRTSYVGVHSTSSWGTDNRSHRRGHHRPAPRANRRR